MVGGAAEPAAANMMLIAKEYATYLIVPSLCLEAVPPPGLARDASGHRPRRSGFRKACRPRLPWKGAVRLASTARARPADETASARAAARGGAATPPRLRQPFESVPPRGALSRSA